MKPRSHFAAALVALAAVLVPLQLYGCASGDGEMLSDAEKIQRASKGRADYQRAMSQGRPKGPAPAGK